MNWGRVRVEDRQFRNQPNPIPWHYGVAYHDASWLVFVCYPVPINFIVRGAMSLRYWWNGFRGTAPEWMPVGQIADRLKLELELGIEIGQTRGYDEGYKAGYDERGAGRED